MLPVEAGQGESALLIGESQDCGVEPKGCHERTCFAASVAGNEFSSKEAMSSDKQAVSRLR
ncbi:Methyl-accepting chemotaxis protein (plasmid) [Nostoc flagelliforme CCNUN1]|uniref:Methyl-accepting chemotaxis protein n=1 Tax=Nostoc flagelliforme CCNUN1 TaxID=2038116 RepID=A0A2K8T7J1_9NOSO|nr:hypothetical protein [Nostoc flagelliforme]AUB43668.1 Methyl-accepting chemotaxis protein [Nostoc flagelliforme CCNUN1]